MQRSQQLPAAAKQRVSFSLSADFDGSGLLFSGVNESGAGQGLNLNTQWVQPAGDSITSVPTHRFFTIDAPVLQAVSAAGSPTASGNKPEVSLDWFALSSVALDVTLWLDIAAVITETVNLPGGFTTTDLAIPSELAPGVYELYAESDLGEGINTSVHGILTLAEGGFNAIYLPMVIR